MTLPMDTAAIWIAIIGLAALVVIHCRVLWGLNEVAGRIACMLDDHDKRLEALEQEHETAGEKREDW